MSIPSQMLMAYAVVWLDFLAIATVFFSRTQIKCVATCKTSKLRNKENRFVNFSLICYTGLDRSCVPLKQYTKIHYYKLTFHIVPFGSGVAITCPRFFLFRQQQQKTATIMDATSRTPITIMTIAQTSSALLPVWLDIVTDLEIYAYIINIFFILNHLNNFLYKYITYLYSAERSKTSDGSRNWS